jgi:hypothetical protein
MYLGLATILAAELAEPDYFRVVWPPIEGYLDDAVVFVRIKLLEFAISIGQQFPSALQVGRLVDAAVLRFAGDDDPAIRELLRDHKLLSLRRPSDGMAARSSGSVLLERQTLKLPKAQNPITFGRKDVLIKRPSLRVASPVYKARSARPAPNPGMPKTVSDGALSRTAAGQ